MSEAFFTLVNPAAGGGRGGRRAPKVLARLAEVGVEVETVFTEAPGDATRLARRAFADGHRRFLAGGGDGTVFEVLNGLFPEALDAPGGVRLGILPLGSGNSFLRDFGDGGAELTVAALAAGRDRPVDVLRLRHAAGELYFLNLLGLGFAASVAARVDRRFKTFGALGYVLGVLSELALLRGQRLSLAADGGAPDEREVTLACICNSRFTGGAMLMAPGADPADGLADLVRAAPMGRLELLRVFPRIYRGTHLGHPAVETSQARCIDVGTGGEVDVMVDGEVLRLEPRRVEVLPGVLTLCV